MMLNNVTFGAKPVKNKIKIKVYNDKTGKYIKQPTTLVHLEYDNQNDIDAMNEIGKSWEDAKYIKKIVTASHWMNVRKYVEIDIYALTLQQKNFDILNADKILGVAEMRNESNNFKSKELNRLQVRPDAINLANPSENKKYKRVGTSILKSIQKIYKSFTLKSENMITDDFYRNNGLIEDCYKQGHFYWNSNIFKRLLLRLDNFKRRAGLY